MISPMKGFMHTLLYNISELVTGTKAIDDEQVSQVCTCKASLYTTVQINHQLDVYRHTYWCGGLVYHCSDTHNHNRHAQVLHGGQASDSARTTCWSK